MTKNMEKLDSKMILLMDSLLSTASTGNASENNLSQLKNVVNLENFKEDFNLTINKYSDSIGWVPLATLRNDITKKYDITENEFYELAEQLINENRSHYELSSGGNEGILVRGLVYGYVRCV